MSTRRRAVRTAATGRYVLPTEVEKAIEVVDEFFGDPSVTGYHDRDQCDQDRADDRTHLRALADAVAELHRQAHPEYAMVTPLLCPHQPCGGLWRALTHARTAVADA